ncbi:cell wall-binding repeat-containing protein [Rossellomorea vietnamensis]|uniref:cell wall-binding repeat-containing protein n=1 Tax=Rossellomorea vietnamensis TaxID=218284 RepID=UPI000761B44D|nr:cell wall-binding repeat 2 family protein [Rossellomorea vietnamensis]
MKTHEKSELFANKPTTFNHRSEENLITLDTKNVSRVQTDHILEASLHTSQMIWPATHDETRPGTVILYPKHSWTTGLASVNFVHHPNNGPVFHFETDGIPEEVINEIERLQPKGNSEGIQIMLMGDVSERVYNQVSSYKVQSLEADTDAQFAYKADEEYARLTDEYPENILIVSSEDEAKLFSLVAGYWIAHMPEPILYVNRNDIPNETIKAIKKRENPNIYILGPETIVSKQVEEKLSTIGNVSRIPGSNPVECSVQFTMFKDDDSGFGWGINKPGRGLSFISTSQPELAIVTTPFSHLGKHCPLLWLDRGKLDDSINHFLAKIKPTFKETPQEGPYNHSYLIGSTGTISYETQGIIDNMLEIVPEDGEGHH